MAGKVTARQQGNQAEDAVGQFLQQQGYQICQRNYTSRYGEIDLIAQKGQVLAFVEVKLRKVASQVSGFASVGRSKQRRILLTALLYLEEIGKDLQPRFDVAAVAPAGTAFSIDYLENAFDAGALQEHGGVEGWNI